MELTLSLAPEVVAQARAYAQQMGQELDALLITYVAELAQRNRVLPALPPDIQALRGSISLPIDADYKQLVAEELAKKYAA